MYSSLTKEEMMQWRRTTEKITLEEFAQRLGKSVETKKETKDLHDIIIRNQQNQPEDESRTEAASASAREVIKTKEEIKQEAVARQAEPVKQAKIVEQVEEKAEKQQKPDLEIKISFKKKLNKREEIVFNYFCRNRQKKVSVADLANLLGLPNDYVYKYIKNLRNKLDNNVLVNADKGGYILNI